MNTAPEQRQALLDAVAAVRAEFAQVTAERDRARSLAARLEQICAERSRLLWLAIEPQPSYQAQAEVGRSIARHLRETEFIAGVTDR